MLSLDLAAIDGSEIELRERSPKMKLAASCPFAWISGTNDCATMAEKSKPGDCGDSKAYGGDCDGGDGDQCLVCKYPCSPGYTRSNGACVLCSAGSFCDGGLMASQIQCSAGTYSLIGQSSCTACSSGFYTNSAGQSSCTQCQAGQYCTSTGIITSCISNCMYCPPGSNAPIECPAGTFSNYFQPTICQLSPTTRYSSGGINCPYPPYCASSSSREGAANCNSGMLTTHILM